MKATKRNKSRGAIIGKALSRLDEGEGLVLCFNSAAVKAIVYKCKTWLWLILWRNLK